MGRTVYAHISVCLHLSALYVNLSTNAPCYRIANCVTYNNIFVDTI